MYCAEYASPVGPLYLASNGRAITHLYLDTFVPVNAEAGDCSILVAALRWLDDYFLGISREIDFPLAPEGTAFQKRVWEALRTIPYGETCSYGDIAREIGCGSTQAVGQAVGANPVGIIIPCHRVVGAKGRLTGYAWGIEKKKWLLEHEKGKR